jgi:hypothetical protein
LLGHLDDANQFPWVKAVIIIISVPKLEVRYPFTAQGAAAVNKGFTHLSYFSYVKMGGDGGAVRQIDEQGFGGSEKGLDF